MFLCYPCLGSDVVDHVLMATHAEAFADQAITQPIAVLLPSAILQTSGVQIYTMEQISPLPRGIPLAIWRSGH